MLLKKKITLRIPLKMVSRTQVAQLSIRGPRIYYIRSPVPYTPNYTYHEKLQIGARFYELERCYWKVSK